MLFHASYYFFKAKMCPCIIEFQNNGTDQLFNTIFLMGWIDMDWSLKKVSPVFFKLYYAHKLRR